MSISNKDLINLLDGLDDSEVPNITGHDLPLDESLKRSICRLFLAYKIKKKKQAKDLVNELEIPKTRISDILNYKTSGYTLDRLFLYAEKLAKIDPQTREHLILMISLLSGPIRSVKEAKKVKKDILKVG